MALPPSLDDRRFQGVESYTDGDFDATVGFDYHQEDSTARIAEILLGHRGTQLLYAAAKLGLFQALADEARSYAEIAHECGAQPDAIRRILRGLVYYGFARQTDATGFAAGPLLGDLRDPRSRTFIEVLAAGEDDIPAWACLEAAARSGKPAFEIAFGEEFFTHLRHEETRLQRHTRIMSGMSADLAEEVAEGFNFSRFRRIVDVGGGEGVVLTAILHRYPQCSGILFDLPEVIASARETLTDEALAGRLDCVAGDFFASVPDGGNLYFLKWILHDWDDQECCTILANCRRAGGRDARLMLCERIAPEVGVPGAAALQSDLTMLVFHHGRERTFAEFDALLQAAHFRFEDALRLPSGRYLLLAVPC